MHRQILGQPGLPPLWLRRHVGPLAGFDRSVGEVSATIALLELAAPGDTVLDMGCGVAALTPDLLRMVGSLGKYVGFDVHRQSIGWAQKAYKNDPRAHFVLAKIQSVYSSKRGVVATDYNFPAGNASIDFGVAKSLFTHLEEPVAGRYLSELFRVLRPGGVALISAFLLEKRLADPNQKARYEFPYGDDRVRWLMEHRPAAGIAYKSDVLFDLCKNAGFEVERVLYGYWRGTSGPSPNAQDLIVLRRPAARHHSS